MLSFLRKIIPERSSIRLFYHKISAVLAAIFYRFPSSRLKIIAVTGTSGKSSTVEIIHHIFQASQKKCGAISTIRFFFGDKIQENTSLRTTLRPWQTQKLLRQMVKEKCEYCVLEVSSHAIDQERIWGINIDTAVLTNIYDNEHLDYHKTFADYIRTKARLFKELNTKSRKPKISKTIILNRDNENFESFNEFPIDKKWTFSRKKPSDIQAKNIEILSDKIKFDLHIPNQNAKITVPLIGKHNLENILAGISTGIAHGIDLEKINLSLKNFPGIPGRLENIFIDDKKNFQVIVDFTYKPSALKNILDTLKYLTEGRLIVVWGGAGGRTKKNLQECATILDKLASEIILTTDDPLDTDPQKISKIICEKINRKEGDNFFEIEDRYEAIRYAIYTADKDDIVLVAGRGHEKFQEIGKTLIPFDDREICREILKNL